MKFRVLIADDEPLGREYVRAMVEEDSRFEVVAVCESGVDAVAQAGATSPDVAFLDIRMPNIDGFETHKRLLETDALVVFVTAYSDYAVRAYESGALDYVTKPIDPTRFAQTLDRVSDRLLERRAAQSGVSADTANGSKSDVAQPAKRLLTGVREDRVYEDSEIQLIESDGNYAKVRIGGEDCIVRESLDSFCRQLDSPPFARVHRSFIVNIRWVTAIRYARSGTAELTLKDGRLVPVSRRHRKAVADMLRSTLSQDAEHS